MSCFDVAIYLYEDAVLCFLIVDFIEVNEMILSYKLHALLNPNNSAYCCEIGLFEKHIFNTTE